ncbi:hypothetical protein EBB59_02540 [Lysobacter pythonis]|uniref:Flagellar FliJ protein n=1 Tax=Solilutibacter pythonis TaxID=2483112 RepID=A0A3M2HWF6_9GAMM|nr:hypothetical protein [Lysobacter pythonis]RMH94061.1 hypothetical protein EBB59_02540 [Lysobacter pythonis]
MNGPRRGLSTLLRWREFQASVAESLFHRESAGLADARSEFESKSQALILLQEKRLQLHEKGRLDIAVLEQIALIEQSAADLRAEARARFHSAEASTASALSRHVEARAASRVVNQRKVRIDGELRQFNEKRLSDQMSDMRVAKEWNHD